MPHARHPPKFGFANAPRGCDGERPRQRPADLRCADGGERADAAFTVAFKITREAAHAGERAHQRAAADPLGAACRQEGAHVRRPKRCKVFQRGGTAEMRGEEGEKLKYVALIGFERFRRVTPLVAEMAQPATISAATLGATPGNLSSPPPERGRSAATGRRVGVEPGAPFVTLTPPRRAMRAVPPLLGEGAIEFHFSLAALSPS